MLTILSKRRVTEVCDWLVPRAATFAFNFLQLGIVIRSVVVGFPVGQIGLLVLSFEIAILLDCFVKSGSTRVWAVSLVVGLIGLYLTYERQSNVTGFAAQCFSVFLCAISLKKIRSITEAVGGLKRYWRAYGYLLAGLFAPFLFLAVAMLVVVATVLSTSASKCEKSPVRRRTRDLKNIDAYLCIILHHWHYFSYAYLVPLSLMRNFDRGPLTAGLLFYIGWLGYYLFTGVRNRQAALLSAGHVLASLAVVGMMVAAGELYYSICWFLTGVGGGTIILHRDLVIHRGRDVYERSKTWEAFGHVAGVLFFVTGLLTDTPNISWWSAIGAGLGCALTALVLARKRHGPRERSVCGSLGG